MEPLVSLVIVNWNGIDDLRECLESIRKQTYKNIEIIVVDNHSTDGSIEMVRKELPEVKLIIMPDSSYGACETFNIGFANSVGKYIGILDNDVTLPKDWVQKLVERFEKERENTAIISTKVIEPGMPDEYLNSEEINKEKYIDTFIGCGSMALPSFIKEVGYYDKKFFIHVNERDLALKLLGKGYRILHYPKVVTYHKKPFGIHIGNRSLYYHIRNYIWVLVKQYSVRDIFLFFVSGLDTITSYKKNKDMRKGKIILGTVGLKEAILHNKGGKKTLCKAIFDAFWGIPYCIKNREVCRSEDLRVPFKNRR